MEAATTTLAPPCPDTLFADAKPLIRRTIAGFIKRKGGNWDDYESKSNELFMHAYDSFFISERPNYVTRRAACKWETWLRRWLWSGFNDIIRDPARRKVRVIAKEIDPNTVVADSSHEHDYEARFSLEGFLTGLSEDAVIAVRLTLEPPTVLAATAEAKGGTPRNFRSTLRQYLVAAGWQPTRVAAAFDELGFALTLEG